MKLGTYITVLLMFVLNRVTLADDEARINAHNALVGNLVVGPNGSISVKPPDNPSTQPPGSTPRVFQPQEIIAEVLKANPVSTRSVGTAQQLFEILATQPSNTVSAIQRFDTITKAVQAARSVAPPDSPLAKPENESMLVAAIDKFSQTSDKAITSPALLEASKAILGKQTELADLTSKEREKTDKEKVEKEQAEAKKQAEEQKKAEAKKQAEAIEKALEQQALASAIQQAAQQGNQGSGGGSGSGSGGGGNSNRPQPPEPPKFDNSQPKHDSLADKLDKALNNNQSSKPDLSSLFNNNNQNSDSFSKKDKEKKDDFKFDLSPKTKQNEVKPTSAKPAADPDSPIDPSSGAGPEQQALQNVISGPTSTPQLISSNGSSALGLGGNGGGGGGPGGGGFSGKVNNPQGSGGEGGGAQDIFNSVGRIEYGDLPPPIRKASPEFSGSGGEGDSGEGFSSSNPSNSKKESLVNELVLLDKNPRSKGLGLMALVGYQMKEICQPSSSKKLGVCKIKTSKNREDKLSLNKF